MVTSEQTLTSVNYIISVYVGFLNIIAGLIGNIIIILVFTQLKLFRGNQSAFYLTVIATVDCCQLIFGTATRVLTTAFGYDPTRTSLAWCKLRAYLTLSCGVILMTTISFSAIDQFFSTNYHPNLRQMSTFKLAQRAVGGLIIFAAFYDIPFLIFNQIDPSAGCGTYNSAFNYFYSFVHLCILIGILPIAVSSLFSLLAYQNVRRIVRRHMPIVRRRLDHQLTAMILVLVTSMVITSIPYISFRIYQINTSVDPNNTFTVAVNQLIRTVLSAIYTVNNSGSFYLFWFSSTRFRRQVKYILFKKNWRKCLAIRIKRNQVAPGGNQAQAVETPRPSVEID